MIDIDTDNLKHGVLGLVIALVEVIRDALKIQAFRRMEGGSLKEDEIERLGEALMSLDAAIEQIKEEQGITQSVQSVRDGLDSIVDDVLNKMINPEEWKEETCEKPIERVQRSL
ncbi:MAG: gas vesicle protein K [candidate division Zixibacteria bacterium]|nr:gas vesicle protein K [candidate division Zixibacteria bacterium]